MRVVRGPKEELRPMSPIHLTQILCKCSIHLFKQFLATFVDDLEGRNNRVGHDNDQILWVPNENERTGIISSFLSQEYCLYGVVRHLRSNACRSLGRRLCRCPVRVCVTAFVDVVVAVRVAIPMVARFFTAYI